VDLGAVARSTPGFSGADLANLANEAALMAARTGGTVVTPADFNEALDKITLGTKQASLANLEERRTVAYHEGGTRWWRSSRPVRILFIRLRQPAGRRSATEQRPEERSNYGRSLRGWLAVMLVAARPRRQSSEPTTGAERPQGRNEPRAPPVGLWG
jgi:hypothetical protein